MSSIIANVAFPDGTSSLQTAINGEVNEGKMTTICYFHCFTIQWMWNDMASIHRWNIKIHIYQNESAIFASMRLFF